jgi:hypothetical protein
MDRRAGLGVALVGACMGSLLLAATVPIPTPGAAGTFLQSQGPGNALTWANVTLPTAGGWQTGLACNLATASANVTANGFYTICGAPWQMNNYTYATSAWTTGDAGAGLAASCTGSGTYGRADPTLSVRYEDVVPAWSVATPVRITACWSGWTPGSSNGGIHTFSQNVWDAGTCQWGTQQNLDYNHVSGNTALFVDEEAARGCGSWPVNLTTLVYSTTFGTGAACVRKTYSAGLQNVVVVEEAPGVTTPPAYPGAWQSYGWVSTPNYLFATNGSGAWSDAGTAGYSNPAWYSTGLGMYCTGSNSAVFTYFGVEYKF